MFNFQNFNPVSQNSISFNPAPIPRRPLSTIESCIIKEMSHIFWSAWQKFSFPGGPPAEPSFHDILIQTHQLQLDTWVAYSLNISCKDITYGRAVLGSKVSRELSWHSFCQHITSCIAFCQHITSAILLIAEIAISFCSVQVLYFDMCQLLDSPLCIFLQELTEIVRWRNFCVTNKLK